MRKPRGDIARLRVASAIVSTLVCLESVTRPVVAQEAPQPILSAQFSFSNPGARSLGLGGAFVAVADDATAAWANPAGLVQIGRPEVSAEGRYWEYSTPYVASGRVRGTPSGIGLDTSAGVRSETSEFDVTGLAFLSFVYPKDRWSLALYRHVLANLETESTTEGVFSETPDGRTVRFLDQSNRSNLEMISYGLSGAHRITETLSIGLGIVYYQTLAEIESDLYFWDDLDDPLGSGTSYIGERFVLGQTLYSDDWSFGFVAGLLWRVTPNWSLGGRYRQGPRVDLGIEARVGSILDLGVPPGSVIDLGPAGRSDFPDNFGLGLAYRSRDGRLTLSFEWDRVTYSDSLESLEVEDQDLDDADEIHLGGEWAFLHSKPLFAARAGVWFDPDHQTRANDEADDFARALLIRGDDEIHFALGFGVAFENFQIDVAADFSDLVDTLSVSAIYSF